MEFSVSQRGEWICVGCDPGRALAPTGIARRLLLVDRGGRFVTADYNDEMTRQRDTEDVVRCGGVVEDFNGDLWVGWKVDDGHVWYANLGYHNAEFVAQRIAQKSGLVDDRW